MHSHALGLDWPTCCSVRVDGGVHGDDDAADAETGMEGSPEIFDDCVVVPPAGSGDDSKSWRRE